MNKPRFPRVDLPPLPEVRELDAHGNDVSDAGNRPRNQWAAQIEAAANASGKVTNSHKAKTASLSQLSRFTNGLIFIKIKVIYGYSQGQKRKKMDNCQTCMAL